MGTIADEVPATAAGMLSRRELAARFNVRWECVKTWQRRGLMKDGKLIKLPTRRLGGRWYTSERELLEWVRALNGPGPGRKDPLADPGVDPAIFGANPAETAANVAAAAATTTRPTT